MLKNQKIGIWIELDGLENLDFDSINDGNPGCGGVEYLSLLLIDMLHKNKLEVVVYSRDRIKWIENRATYVETKNVNEALTHFNNVAGGGALF